MSKIYIVEGFSKERELATTTHGIVKAHDELNGYVWYIVLYTIYCSVVYLYYVRGETSHLVAL